MSRSKAKLTLCALTSAALWLSGAFHAPARPVGPDATMRQLAGAIPRPFKDAVAVAKVGNEAFVLDGHAVERVDLSRSSEFSFLAGRRHAPGTMDGAGDAARFNTPRGLTGDATYLYVADTNNHTIRRIALATGEVTTFAGAPGQPGSADGTAGAARFKKPVGLALLGGHLWVTDAGNKTVRKVEVTTASVTTVAGSAGAAGTTDGTGTAARFTSPRGITTNGKKLWLTDGNRVRRLVPETTSVTTLASVEPVLTLTGITVTGGKLYAIHPNHYDPATEASISSQVRMIDPASGSVVRFAFTWHHSQGIASDASNIFTAEDDGVFQRSLDPRGRRAVGGFGELGTADGIAGEARFSDPTGVTSDGSAVYIADPAKDAIRKVVIATGEVTTLATGIVDPLGLTNDGTNVYVSQGNKVLRVSMATGGQAELAVVGSKVNDIAADTARLYVTNDDCAVYAVDKGTGSASVLAGLPGSCGATDGIGPTARFAPLRGITRVGDDLFVTTSSSIRKIEIATGEVTTVVPSSDEVFSLRGIAGDGTHLYAVDRGFISSIVRVDPTTGSISKVSRGCLNPLPLTYNPTPASETQTSTFCTNDVYGIVADQNRLFFTDVTGVGVISDP